MLMLACIAVTALPASAARNGAYPGGNGVIAFVQYSSAGVGDSSSAMNPDGSAPRAAGARQHFDVGGRIGVVA